MKFYQTVLIFCLLATSNLWAIGGHTYIFQGKIDNKYEIVIRFNANLESDCAPINGAYVYTNTFEPMKIEGEWCVSKKTLTIKRMKDYKPVETFVFTKFNGKNGTGTWTKDNQQFPCSIVNLETKVAARASFPVACNAAQKKIHTGYLEAEFEPLFDSSGEPSPSAYEWGTICASTNLDIESMITTVFSDTYFQALPHASNLFIITTFEYFSSTCAEGKGNTSETEDCEQVSSSTAEIHLFQWENKKLKEIPTNIKLGKTDGLSVWGEYFVATNSETKARQIWHWNGTTLVKMK